jgi:hypothetical protein
VEQTADHAAVAAPSNFDIDFATDPENPALDAAIPFPVCFAIAPLITAIDAAKLMMTMWIPLAVPAQADVAAARPLFTPRPTDPANGLIAATAAWPVCLSVDPAKLDVAAARDFCAARMNAPANVLVLEASDLPHCFATVTAKVAQAPPRPFAACFALAAEKAFDAAEIALPV